MFDNYAVTVMIGGEPYTLGLFDTAGLYSLFHLRVLNQLVSKGCPDSGTSNFSLYSIYKVVCGFVNPVVSC